MSVRNPGHPTRRTALGTGLALLASASATVHAQDYPNRPVQLVVPWPPGGGADTLTRTLAPHLSRRLGQPVVIDNRPGAGGNIGAAAAAKAAPDGHSVLIATAATHAINPGLYATMPFKPADFLPVGRLVTITNVLTVHPSVPAKTVQELIALARTSTLNYASAGNGSTQHLSAEMFKNMTGVNMQHVPYKGGGPAVAATLAGETQVLFADPLAALSFVQSGRLRAVAVTGATRLPSMPDLPTVAESGVPGFEAINWIGVMVPTGTPPRIITALNEAFNAVIAQPDVRERLASQGYEARGSTADEFGRMVVTETERWGRIIKAAGVKID